MDTNAKSQAVERIKEAQNVLITVSNNPSVDQLSAAIGLTIFLNKLDKHATAVFSGAIPSTLEFLQPEDTLEPNTDSLRDFIVSLDKSKADKLKYKVEDDVVRIYITPYKTSLSEEDLRFTQGDFNVDVVVALGVQEQEQLDQAIRAHGRIFHDATVIGVWAGEGQTEIGSINWVDSKASSLCEMLMAISEALQSGNLDPQIATAYLTGIVANTDRFRNDLTTPKVMSMSAQLMSAGANQQLIATELAKPVVEDTPVTEETESNTEEEQEDNRDYDVQDGVLSLRHNEPKTKPDTNYKYEPGIYKNQDQQQDISENTGNDDYDFQQDSSADSLEQMTDGEYEQGQQDNQDPQTDNNNDTQEEYPTVDNQDIVKDQPEIDDYGQNGEEIADLSPNPDSEYQKPPTDDGGSQQGNQDNLGTDYIETGGPQTIIKPTKPIEDQDLDGELTLPEPRSIEDYPEITHARTADQFLKDLNGYKEKPKTDSQPDNEPEQEYSKFMTEPPVVKASLNSLDMPLPSSGEPDPLMAIDSTGPISPQDMPSTIPPQNATDDDMESPLASTTPSTPSELLQDDGESDLNSKPLGPAVDATETLSEIEQEVKEYKQDTPISQEDALEKARREVQAIQDSANAASGGDGSQDSPPVGFVPLDSEPELPAEQTGQIPQFDPQAFGAHDYDKQQDPPDYPPPFTPFGADNQQQNNTN
jgi:nanoRNase/pAp phosphatase (c-di-AMP/oligoRNAs hydrolase)